MTFEGVASSFQNRYGTADQQGQQVEQYQQGGDYFSNFSIIPTFRIGQKFNPQDATAYPSDMNLVAQQKAAAQSVVRIEAQKGVNNDGSPSGSVGTGFIVTSSGEVATAYHVVNGATNLNIQVGNMSYGATVEAVDRSSDLALLKINSGNPYQTFRPLPLAPSSQMQPGDVTIAFGYPGGLNRLFMSPGGFSWAPGGFQGAQRIGDVVGRLQGGLMPGENPNRTMIEAQISVDPGNSGGPLLNDRFQVVGLVDIATTQSTKADATPVEDIYRLLDQTRNGYQRAALETAQPFYGPPAQSSWSNGQFSSGNLSSFSNLAKMLDVRSNY